MKYILIVLLLLQGELLITTILNVCLQTTNVDDLGHSQC
jgi:hypothetical protein